MGHGSPGRMRRGRRGGPGLRRRAAAGRDLRPKDGLVDTWRDPERLGRVTAIGFVKGDLLLADATARCIRRYDASAASSTTSATGIARGLPHPERRGRLRVDAEGIIHAANPGKHRVERYTPDGALLGHFGRFDGRDPAGFSGCCNPTNVAVDGRGRIYVTEKAARAPRSTTRGQADRGGGRRGFDSGCRNMDITVDRGPGLRGRHGEAPDLRVFRAPRRGMSDEAHRRDVLGHAARGAALAGLGGLTGLLIAEGRRDVRVAGRRDPVRQQPARGRWASRCASSAPPSAWSASPPCGRSTSSRSAGAATSARPTSTSPARWTRRACRARSSARATPSRASRSARSDPEDPSNNFYEYVIDEREVRWLRPLRAEVQGTARARLHHPARPLRQVRELQPLRDFAACPKDALEQIALPDALKPGQARHTE